jgi:hypothetical protein
VTVLIKTVLVLGTMIVQSAAIERWISTSEGLAGNTAAENAKCDMWYETFKELIKGSHSRWVSGTYTRALATPYILFARISSRWGKVFAIDNLKVGLEEPRYKNFAGNPGEKFKDIISFKDTTNGGEYSAFERSYFAIKVRFRTSPTTCSSHSFHSFDNICRHLRTHFVIQSIARLQAHQNPGLCASISPISQTNARLTPPLERDIKTVTWTWQCSLCLWT